MYAHTDTSDFSAEQDWTYGYGTRKSLGTLSFETWPVDTFYSYFELPLMNTFGVVDASTNPNTLLPTSPAGYSLNKHLRGMVHRALSMILEALWLPASLAIATEATAVRWPLNTMQYCSYRTRKASRPAYLAVSPR